VRLRQGAQMVTPPREWDPKLPIEAVAFRFNGSRPVGLAVRFWTAETGDGGSLSLPPRREPDDAIFDRVRSAR
jgi:hypothetical protein